MPTSTRPSTPLTQALTHLQPRDKLLVDLLSEHQVLSTDQIQAMLFTSLRTCQKRLSRLRQLGMLASYRRRNHTGGQLPARWILGPLGWRLHAAAGGAPLPTSRAIAERIDRIAASPVQSHRLGVNQFFVDLITHTHSHPGTRLVRWWGEQRAASLLHGVVPDGHGIWHTNGHTVAWFLEYDTGSEDLPRLVAKLAAYDRAARSGSPTWPVLLWLHSPVREHNLHRLLDGALGRCPVATAVRTPPAHPAGRVWWLSGHTGRRSLDQLGGEVDSPDGTWRR